MKLQCPIARHSLLQRSSDRNGKSRLYTCSLYVKQRLVQCARQQMLTGATLGRKQVSKVGKRMPFSINVPFALAVDPLGGKVCPFP